MLRLLRSTSARLVLGYAVLFALSSLLTAGFLWWRTASYLDRQTDIAITAEIGAIGKLLQSGGRPAAIAAVAAFAGDRSVILLTDAGGHKLAGNLAAWPPEIGAQTGWRSIGLRHHGENRMVRLRRVTLPGDLNLMVGRDIEDRIEIHGLVVDALAGAGAGALILAIGGGILLRRAVLRRVEMINAAATAIVHGDLERRVPTRETTDVFDQLAETVNTMLHQIQQLIEGVRNTSNAIAHDLRTPLAELRARLEELTRSRAPIGAVFEEIQKAVADLDRVIGVFNALLRLAEIDSGMRRSGFRRVELAGLVNEVAELYGPLTEEKQAEFVVDAPDGLAVNGDPFLLAQAVGNLVDNAVKYAPRHGAVSLRLMPTSDGRIDIVVADNGPGIAEGERTRVTQRFYRCDPGDLQPGIGLGLSVVDAVARLHEGILVFADNHPGLVAQLKIPAA